MSDPYLTQTTVLLKSARGGDDRATNELFVRYLPRVRRIVAARMGKTLSGMSEHEDIVQETLLDAFTGLAKCDPMSVGSFYNWLARAAQNNIVDASRRAGAQKRDARRVRAFVDLGRTTLGDPGFSSGDGTPSEILSSQEMDGQLEQSLLALRDEYREIVILRILCEMSFEEISAEMKVADTAKLRTWLSRALAQMRDSLGEQVDGLPRSASESE